MKNHFDISESIEIRDVDIVEVACITISIGSYLELETDIYIPEDQCPVNTHLTPGLGIYFNAFIHIAPGQGQTTPWG